MNQQATNLQYIHDIFILDTSNEFEKQIIQQCFDIVGVFIVAIDPDGDITMINNKAAEMLNQDKESLIGKNLIDDFLVDEYQNKARELFKSVIEKKAVYPEDVRYNLEIRNNRQITLEAKNIIIRDKDNNNLGILISGKDITEYVKSQHDLRNDINLYRMLANNIPNISLFLFDRDFRFIIAEGTNLKNKGIPNQYFEGKRLTEIDDEETCKLWLPIFKRAFDGETVSHEYKYKGDYFSITALPILNRNKDVIMGVAINQDITSEKLNALKLKESKEKAEEANRAKSEFLARVSHEIRTPLNAILGFTEQLLQTQLDKKQEDYVKIVDKSSEHLLSLINDILILSKIEARQINFDSVPFKIEHTLQYVYKALNAKAEAKNLKFTYSIDDALNIVLIGDPFRLRQILINMLSNAIKFTDRGYVELKCFLQEEDDEEIKVRFDISDSGIGINAEKLETIFEQFNQANAEIAKRYGGTGLGLTICKNLIEMQDGSLSVSSQEHVGTTFTFAIPYTRGKESDRINADMGSVDGEKLKDRKVLLVDDDSVNRLLGITILQKFNCKIDIAKNGTEAIDSIAKTQYDIVLLDIHMPDISGLEVAKYLRNIDDQRATKIIAVTAAAMKDDIENYYKAGIDDFLIKPFKEINLFNKMCEVLNLKNESFAQSRAEIILKEELLEQEYNLAELKSMAAGNQEFIDKMLVTLIENTDSALQAIKRYASTEKWEEVGEAAHKILPSYRHIQATAIVNILTRIKIKALVEPDFGALPPLVEKALHKLQHIIKQLKKELVNPL